MPLSLTPDHVRYLKFRSQLINQFERPAYRLSRGCRDPITALRRVTRFLDAVNLDAVRRDAGPRGVAAAGYLQHHWHAIMGDVFRLCELIHLDAEAAQDVAYSLFCHAQNTLLWGAN